MAVLTQPDLPSLSAKCIIDGTQIGLGAATIVSQYANGKPALACQAHRDDKLSWISQAMVFEQHPPTPGTPPPSEPTIELYVEERHVNGLTDLKSDICWHMITRSTAGRILVVTAHPIEFLSTVRKCWKKLTKQILIERARTLQKSKVANLELALGRLHSLRFSGSLKSQDADIIVLSAEALAYLGTSIATVYICQPLPDMQRAGLISTLQSGSVIIDYFQAV